VTSSATSRDRPDVRADDPRIWLPTTAASDEQVVAPFAALAAVLRERGVDPVEVLASCGLAADTLDDPSRRIPFAAAGALFDAAARRTGCAHLGLLVGQHFRLAGWGVLGALAQCAATLGDALSRLSVYQRLYSAGTVIFLEVDRETAAVYGAIHHPDTAGAEHIADLMGQIIFTGLRELAGPGWHADEVLLARARPAATGPYRKGFHGLPRFDADCTGVRFPAPLLAQPLRSADPARFDELEGSLMAARSANLVADLRRALRVELIRGHARASRVTNVLAMHQRTLHRRLAEAGTSFQVLLDEVRYDAARHYLLSSTKTLADIAAALGYSELSAFTRAFRRWSGVTPGAYRQQRGPGQPSGRSAA
jgi:AraC-like DNA-binding protein